MKKVGIKDLSKTGKTLIFMLFLQVALIPSCMIAERLAAKSSPKNIEACIAYEATKNNVSPALIKAIIWRESRFNPNAVGKANEIGLMQITDGAVADWCRINKKSTPSRRSLFKPSLNIEIGTWYLAHVGNHWNGYKSREILQISEYNAGYGNVSKKWKPKSPQLEVRLQDITIESTRKYVETVLQKKAEYEKGEAK